MGDPAPENINVILATDCGSTTTKAILIEKIDGHYRQTYRGEAPTTVEQPAADVTMGVVNAVTEVSDREESDNGNTSVATFLDWRAQQRSFTDITVWVRTLLMKSSAINRAIPPKTAGIMNL